MKYWEALLTNQHKRGRDGLTIPFIIGSQMYLPIVKLEKQNVEDLILDIVSNNSFETCLRYCMGIETLILEIRKPNNNVYYPNYNGQKQINFSIGLALKDIFGDSVENVIQLLTDDFQPLIKKNLFSAEPDMYERSAQWRVFNETDDIPFIKNTFILL